MNLLESGTGYAQRTVTLPAAGLAGARLTAASGDWDLAIFDKRTGRTRVRIGRLRRPRGGRGLRRRRPRAGDPGQERVRDELPSRIEAWLRRVAPHEPLFALALVYSFDGPAVPPAVGLGTERERRALLASARHDRERIWNPADWEILDREAPELLADGLGACWRQLAREWERASDDGQPRALLVEVAESLAGARLPGPPRAVYTVDDRLADLDRNLRATVPATVRAVVESADR